MAISKQTGVLGGLAALAVTGITVLALSPNIIEVPVGGDIQAAINAAQCGDTVVVQAGGVYPANLTLPNKNCTEFITVQSSRAGELPAGERVNPAIQSLLLATLQSTINAEPVIKTATAAHHYKFIGVHVKTQSPTVFVYDLVRFGEGRQTQATPESVPHHLILDRSWVEGNGEQETQRGVTLNCADCGVINSYTNNIKARGMDTQAVCGWNGTLRAYVLNSYLEATGENVMWGGADPASAQLIPTAIEVRRNTIRKLMAWKGQGYTIKNLVEIKNCIGCTVDGNVIENNWGNEGQAGAAIVVTVRNQDCAAPFSTIQNGVFTNNIVRNSDGVFNFLGEDNEAKPTYEDRPGHPKCSDPGESYGSVRGNGFLVANNVFDKITGAFITINGYYNVIVENNTDRQTCGEGCNTTTFYGEQSLNYTHRNNVHDEKAYGLTGDGSAAGKPTLDKYAPNAVVTGNVIASPYAPWPAGNQAVTALTITSDYRTPYPAGADIDALLAAQAGVIVSQPNPTPSATATATVTPTPTPTPLPSSSPSPVVGGIPAGSAVEVTSAANVREGATVNSAEKFIAPAGLRGTTTAACQQDPASVNVYCAVSFADSSSGFVAMQFLRVVVSAPIPSPTPLPTIAPPSPSPTVVPSPVATPSPSPIPTATPAPTPTPQPSPAPLPFCVSGARPGTPPTCRCRNGTLGSSGKCR